MTEYKEPSFPGVFREAEFQDSKTILKKLLQVLAEWETAIKIILDHGISFNDNMDVQFVTFTSNATPDTQDTVAHTLRKVPTHMIPVSLDKGAVVYRGGTTWTASNIYVKTTVASTAVTLMIF